MQPYSELANWDGSLEDLVVDPLGPPSPSDTPSLPMYDQYHHNQSVDQQAGVAHILSATTSSSPSTSISLSHFGPSATSAAALFPSTSALSPQEREIMADITLDPDDPDDLEPSRVASSAGASASSTVTGGAWAWAALAPEAVVKNVNDDNASRQHPIVPAPPAVSITTSSVSPSPFAPPPRPASATIAGPVSQSLPLPSSSSSSLRLTVNVRAHPDQPALSSSTGSEDVMEHTSASISHPDAGEAGPRGNSTADHLDAFTHDPPDQPQPRAQSRQGPVLPPLDTTNRSSSSCSSPRHSPKTPLFLPSPSESVPPSRPLSAPLPPEESDVISIDSSSSSPPPSRRLRRRTAQIKSKTNKRGRQLMAYVLIPPLPSGARRSSYVPVEKVLRMRKRRAAAKKKLPIGDNTSSSALVAALQGAFENNSIGAGSTKTPRARRRGKTKAVVPVEVVEVVDDVDEVEDDGDLRTKESNDLACALSSAFAHNSANPNVAARPAAVEKGRMHQLRRSTRAGVSSDGSANVEVILPSPPAKRSRPRLRTRVTSDAEDSNTVSSRRRNEKRQPQTPTSPQKKKRRRLAGRGDGDEVDEQEGEEEDEVEIEIVDRELPRRASKTKPHYSKAERKHRRASMPSPAPTRTSSPSPSPSPSPPLESPASPPDTNSLAGLPLMILPAPAAADIVIPPRALNHLHASPGPLNSKSKFETRHQDSVQGFHREGAAIGAHGLLESPSIVAAISSTISTTTTTMATTINSIRANPAGPLNPPIDLGLDVIVPMDVTDGKQERQDAVQATVVPPHALRISSSTHPDGPMLGFMLSEYDDAGRTTSLSADTEASSDGIGLEPDAKTTAGMEFMLLDSMDHNSSLKVDLGWVDWHVTPPSTGLAVENEFVGDGTIDPAVLGGAGCFGASLGGGSPNKAVVRSDDYIRSHRSPLFTRTRDNYESLDNHDSDDLGDEGDVMELLFENSTDGTVSRSPSARGTGGKGKKKEDTETIDDADVHPRQIDTDINARGGTRERRKSWRKALADDNNDYEESDTESTVARPCLSNVSNNLSSPVTATFCHHCRRKTFRPKMCCTDIKESTGKQCGKMYCDLCIQKRYPGLTFNEFATSFSCPCCGNFCNCTHCARGRGEAYIPERNGGWRRWAALFPVAAAAATSGPISPSPKEASQDGTRAKAALTAQESLETDNTMRIVPDEPSVPLPLPSPPHPTSNTLISSPHLHVHPIPTTSTAATKSVVDKKRCQHVYIGKWQKLWGRPVPVPVPDPDPEDRRGSGRNGLNKRKRAVRVRLFVGSEKPLLLNQKLANIKKAQKNSKRGRGRKKALEVEKDEQRQIASSLPPPSRSSSVVAHDGDANQNAALYEEHDPDSDVDKGVWPGEYAHAHAHDEQHIPFVPPGVFAMTISPEELGRAIGAAFAAGMQY